MNENIKALLEKVSGDEGLLAKFSACKSVDEAFELAKELVGGFTKEEFVEAMSALSAAEDADVSDADLSEAAGGEDNFVEISAKSVSKSVVGLSKSVASISKDVYDAFTKPVNVVDKSVKSVAKSLSKVSKTLAV